MVTITRHLFYRRLEPQWCNYLEQPAFQNHPCHPSPQNDCQRPKDLDKDVLLKFQRGLKLLPLRFEFCPYQPTSGWNRPIEFQNWSLIKPPLPWAVLFLARLAADAVTVEDLTEPNVSDLSLGARIMGGANCALGT